MKKILFTLLAAAVLLSCQPKAPKTIDATGGAATSTTVPAKKATKSDISYAFGILIGADIKNTGVEIDLGAFQRGMKEASGKTPPKLSIQDASGTVQAAIEAARIKKSEDNLANEKKFFETNKAKKGMLATESGLQYEVIKEGTGAKPVFSDSVKVDYVGTLLDGTVFDSSVARKEPVTFPLAGVIPGWTEGIQLMTVGSKYKFYIPSILAYGDQGAGNVIPPNSTLIFEVDLLSIETPPAQPAAPATK